MIATYGMVSFLRLYQNQDIPAAMVEVYHKPPEALNQAFAAHLRLFKTYTILEQRMQALLEEDSL